MPKCLGFIYGLTDPRTGDVRYVGRAVEDPWWRYQTHLRDTSGTHKSHWVQGLLSSGLSPRLMIIESEVPRSQINDREIWWIAAGRAWGWELTNGTRGGDGVVEPSEQTRERMRKAWKTRPSMTDAQRETWRRAQLGREFSPEVRSKISESVKHYYTDEMRAEKSRQMSEWWAQRRREKAS